MCNRKKKSVENERLFDWAFDSNGLFHYFIASMIWNKNQMETRQVKNSDIYKRNKDLICKPVWKKTEKNITRHTYSNFSSYKTPILGIPIQTLSLVKIFVYSRLKNLFQLFALTTSAAPLTSTSKQEYLEYHLQSRVTYSKRDLLEDKQFL